LPDGRVEAYAIGTPEQLASFRQALENGPSSGSVSEVVEQPDTIQSQYESSFTITYDA